MKIANFSQMKTVISLLTISLILCLPASAQFKISQEPLSTSLKPADQFPFIATNAGAGTFTTKRVSFQNIMLSLGTNNFVSSNQTLVSAAFYPSNIFTGPGVLVGSPGSGRIFTISGGTTAGMHNGDQFVITNDQWDVVKVIDTTHILVFQPITKTYAAAPYTWYPNAALLYDINKNVGGFIGSDGTLGTVGNFDNVPASPGNSAKFVWNNGSNTWMVVVMNQFNGNRLEFRPWLQAGGSPFNIYETAQYDSVDVNPDSNLSVKYGITNAYGAGNFVNLWGPVSVPAFLTNAATGVLKLGGQVSVPAFVTNATTGVLTLGGQVNVPAFLTNADTGTLILGGNLANNGFVQFAGTTQILGIMSVGANVAMPRWTNMILTTASSYSPTINDEFIFVTATGQTVTLPTAVGIKGRRFLVKMTQAGSSTVACFGSEKIDGASTYSLSAANKYVHVVSDGSNWQIIANN